MATPIDYKSILQAVKDVRKALTRRGHRPGHLVLILTPPGDSFIGSSEDMDLNEVRNLLQMALRGLVPTTDSVLSHEVCVMLRGLKLPDQWVVVARDNHTGEYSAWVNETALAPAVGEAMFQVGRLIGIFDGKAAMARKEKGLPTLTTPGQTVLTAKKPRLAPKWKFWAS